MSNTKGLIALRRFSVSMAGRLTDRLDAVVREEGFASRSQALAEMVRAHLVEREGGEDDREIAGSITLVYDHHRRNIQSLLTEIQHDHGDLIAATMHVHLDHRNCLEVLAVRGKARAIRKMADRLVAARGVKHGRLTVTTTGRDFPA
ncbi:MAG: nickel-responsive transcriptional regulator NikR [Planctomycetes bacterium]|jgi:CopG family nickel-responsive transcriptional regulator|nr:nickel-responsive transcriptional regulator NikR [Planctomycetota bacterium]